MPKGQRALATQPWPEKGWDYHTIDLLYADRIAWSAMLGNLGQEGWLLVSIIHDENPAAEDARAIAIFTRPLDKTWRPLEKRLAAKEKKQRAASSMTDEADDDELDDDEEDHE